MPKKLPPTWPLVTLLVTYGLCPGGTQGQWAIDWKSDAATTLHLTPAEIESLARDKVLVSRNEVEQSFAAYTQSRTPTFVTSDAVLSGYHVLFEESMRVWEENCAAEMAVHLPVMWTSITALQTGKILKGDEALIQAAWTRARFVIGVAHGLMGGELAGVPPALRTIIADEVARVERAEGLAKPALLGLPDPDFTAWDYTAFKPQGLYASSSELQRYFRVTRWLQRVPFRSEFKEEYLAYYLLGVMYPARNKAADAASRWMGLRSDFFGKLFCTGTHWELARCNEWQSTEHPVSIDHHFFKSKAEILVVRAESIGGEATLWPEDRERAEGAPRSKAVGFRVFSPFTRPENAAFEALRHLPGQEQSGGLQLSAWLGIDSARQLVGPHVLSVLDRHGPRAKKILGDDFPESALWWRQGNWVEVTMKLRGVWHGLTELDARAPNFMRSPLWHKKTLNAVAASWVQDCHAWTVPLKPSAITPLAVGRARGLVEPVPEFYLRMSWIAKWMAQEIAEVEVYRNPVPARIRDTQRLAESLRAKVKLNPTEEQIEDLLWTAAGVLAKIDFSHGVKLGGPPTIIGVLAAADELDALAHDLALEAKPGGRLWRQVLLTTVRLEPLWKELEVLCLRLSMIAGKQLAGETLTLEESNVVLFFGLTLSRIMLYEDAAPSFPVDDSPKIVRPAAGPSRGTAFHAATGRPRILYVLYPWQGSELFCQGVILPYHEVESDRPMDDQEWRKLWPRTAGSRPQAAKWLEGFIPAEGARVTERGNE